jgi:hypothetical protein
LALDFSFCRPSPKFPGRDPEFPDHDPKFPDRDPEFPDLDPKFPDRDPEFPDHDPKFPDRDPEFPDRDPKFPDRDPEFPDRDPKFPDVFKNFNMLSGASGNRKIISAPKVILIFGTKKYFAGKIAAQTVNNCQLTKREKDAAPGEEKKHFSSLFFLQGYTIFFFYPAFQIKVTSQEK